MNVQDYIASGFPLSTYTSQAAVTRAEQDVCKAYIAPILPKYNAETEPVRSAIMALAFLRLQQSSLAQTRAGAKQKQTAQSNTPSAEDVLNNSASTCAIHLKALRQIEGANADAKVDDICKIFFVSQFFHN